MNQVKFLILIIVKIVKPKKKKNVPTYGVIIT